MNSEKYIGLDVHQATISVAVLDASGKLLMESILETSAATILSSSFEPRPPLATPLTANRAIWFALRWSLGGGVASIRSQGGPNHHVAQFTNVSRPTIVAQNLDCLTNSSISVPGSTFRHKSRWVTRSFPARY